MTSPVEQWGNSRYWSFIRSALRRASSKYPPKFTVLNKAKRKYTGPDKKRKFEYQCNICKGWFANKEVSVDHIIPAGSLLCYEDLPGFVERLFCPEEGLQVICTDKCHAEKTRQERGLDAFSDFRALPAQKQKDIIEKLGAKPASNKQGREEQIKELTTEERLKEMMEGA